MFRSQFQEWRYLYKLSVGKSSTTSISEIHSCPSFSFGGENWSFDLCRSNSSLSVKIIRSRSRTDVLLKSQVAVTDYHNKMTENYSKQITCTKRKDRNVSYELAVMNDFYIEENADANNEMFNIVIDLVLNEISADGMVDPLKVEDKLEARRLLSEDILCMYDQKMLTDIVLNVQGEEIEVHKVILCSRSPVFATMFQQPMVESGRNVVDIKDIQLATMKKLVDFMYSKSNSNYDFDEAMELYDAAHIYEVWKLKEKCSQIIRSKITQDNIIQALELADRHKDGDLKNDVMQMIISNFVVCVKADWWDEFASPKSELYKELKSFIS